MIDERFYYYKITEDELLEVYNGSSGEIINLYIDNPFCLKHCKFCAYKRHLYNKEKYNKFYTEYLHDRIAFFNKAAANKKLGALTLGGGTPNLMTPDIMRSLFSSIDRINEFELKVIEIHPALWNIEQLDVLREYNFDIVTIGIQSFNNEVLKSQNRIPAQKSKIERLFNELKLRKFIITSDIISFLQVNHTVQDAIDDLYALNKLEPDIISFSCNYYNFTESNEKSTITIANDFVNFTEFEFFKNSESKLKKIYTPNIRFVKSENAEYLRNIYNKYIRTLPNVENEIKRWDQENDEFINFAIGNLEFQPLENESKTPKNTISYKNRKICYIEVNESSIANYYVIYDNELYPNHDDFVLKLIEVLHKYEVYDYDIYRVLSSDNEKYRKNLKIICELDRKYANLIGQFIEKLYYYMNKNNIVYEFREKDTVRFSGDFRV